MNGTDSVDTLLITGATGLVGSYLCRDALASGLRVRAAVRGGDRRVSSRRLLETLSFVGVQDADEHLNSGRLDVVPVDLAAPRLGLGVKAWQALAESVGGVFHAGAYLGFRAAARERAMSINIDGTREMLALTAEAGVPFHYVSTAYVAGDYDGCVDELPDVPLGSWKNCYEESKYLAEREVTRAAADDGLAAVIYRPAILIGESATGRTFRFNTLYPFLKMFHLMSRRRQSPPITVDCHEDATLNLVPIDTAVAAMWELSRTVPSPGLQIYHITNPTPPSMTELGRCFSEVFGVSIAPRHCPDVESARAASDDAGDSISLYVPYLFGEPRFSLRQTLDALPDYVRRFPALDAAYFRRLVDFAAAHRWGTRGLPSPPPAEPALPGTYPERYFLSFLPGKLQQQLIRNLRQLSAVVAIRFQDASDATWRLAIEQGCLTAIERGVDGADCQYVTDSATFEEIARGQCHPQRAFFEGRVDIQGDLAKGLRVATALAEFFAAYPYHPEAD